MKGQETFDFFLHISSIFSGCGPIFKIFIDNNIEIKFPVGLSFEFVVYLDRQLCKKICAGSVIFSPINL